MGSPSLLDPIRQRKHAMNMGDACIVAFFANPQVSLTNDYVRTLLHETARKANEFLQRHLKITLTTATLVNGPWLFEFTRPTSHPLCSCQKLCKRSEGFKRLNWMSLNQKDPISF